MLLERRGEIVLREEIRKRLWPNDTVVEISHGINAAVLRLRDALGETAESPRFIETVARRGYRFRGETAPPALPASHYRLDEQIGAGGMGIVYRAEDLRLGRQVALKVLPAELASDPASLDRFHREARAASALTHPNICTVYGVEEHAGQPVIAMELLEGETLESLLAHGALPAARALGLAIPIASALAAAHRKGIAHRDLKPANILITEAGLKVLDFGLAKIDPPAALESHVTERGAILGTLHYMSPEQAQGKDAGFESDIFSFGVLLYEMLAGRRPFEGENSATVMASILKSDPAPLEHAELWRIVARCLAKDPAGRWQSAADLKAALEGVAAPPPINRGRGIPRLFLWTAACALLIGLILVAPAARNTSLWPQRPMPKRDTMANVTHPVISPDGAHIAYRTNGQLYIRALNDNVVRSVESSAGGANTPFWSPDSRSLAFVSQGVLKIVSVAGGAPRLLAPVNTNLAGAWGPDGTILIGLLGEGIFRIPAAGGAFTRVTELDAARNETRHLLPQFLPDGRRFLYTAATNRPGESMICAASLDSPERSIILQSDTGAEFVPAIPGGSKGYLLFERAGSLLATPFDTSTLRVSGEPVRIADSLVSAATIGSAARVAEFSATPTAIAWRNPGAASLVSIQQNWMLDLRR